MKSETNAMVVETGFGLPFENSSYSAPPGSGIDGVGTTRRRGIRPPSARRRSSRYCTSRLSGPGW